MSKATVNETMKALKAKNAVEVDEGDENNKALKRKEALHNLAEKKKHGGSKRKLRAKRTVISSDEEEEEEADVQNIDLDQQGTINNKRVATKKKKNKKKIPKEILLANAKRERVYSDCTCTPASLTDSYEKGASYCACFSVNLWMTRTHSTGVDRYTMTLRDLSRKYCKKKLKDLEPPDIVVYNPSETEEPCLQQLDQEDEEYSEEAAKKPVKGKKGKQIISREAEEEPYDPEEEIQSDPEPVAKKQKQKTCTCCCCWYYCFCL